MDVACTVCSEHVVVEDERLIILHFQDTGTPMRAPFPPVLGLDYSAQTLYDGGCVSDAASFMVGHEIMEKINADNVCVVIVESSTATVVAANVNAVTRLGLTLKEMHEGGMRSFLRSFVMDEKVKFPLSSLLFCRNTPIYI